MSIINDPVQNNILAAAEQKIESQLTAQNRANYMKIVVGGMKVALAKGPQGILGSLKQSKNPINDCAVGAVNLCLLMRKQARGTMPMKAMVPAGMTLMIHALDFADKTGIAKVGTQELVQATHIFTNHLFKQLGITPKAIHTAANNIHGIMQDPAKMAAINQKAGFTKHPNAKPMPEAGNGV